jgi:hypothetical protein
MKGGQYPDRFERFTFSSLRLCRRRYTFRKIYQDASASAAKKIQQYGPKASLIFHLSPGNPAMAAVWILLAKTRFPAQLIESF